MGVKGDGERSKAANLRRRAGERLREATPAGPPPRAADEMLRLIHELQVHQIELELQNEELRQARDESEELVERYTDLYDFAPIGYFTLDPVGTILAANLTAASLLGIERSRLIGRRFGLIVAAPERPAFGVFLDAVFTGGGKEVCETALLSEGTFPPVVQIAASVTASGQECRLAAIDITGRRQAEDALRESEDRLYRLAAMAIDAIIMLGELGTVTFCNAAAEKMFGYPAGGLTGANFQGLFVPGQLVATAKEAIAPFEDLFSEPAPGSSRDRTGIRRDGTRFPLELSISGMKLRDSWHAIAILRDTTGRKTLEAQLLQAQKMETIGLLAGGIAHDFNNILNVIIGYGSLFDVQMSADDPLRKNLGEIMAAAQRGANLTRSLLDFARKQPINPLPTRLHDILGRSQKSLERVIGEDIRLEVACSEEGLNVTVDGAQIEAVLTNLATNAKAAMPDGGTLSILCTLVELDADFIRLHGFGRPGHFALVSVADTGIGMDRETTRRVFEPFFTTKVLGKGTGLGLSSVYSIVKQHDGYVDVGSELGVGTTFRVYLPLTSAEVDPGEQVTESASEGGTETILLAEDDDAVRNLTAWALTRFGYRVITATDGENAVTQFLAHRESIQLLLFDMIMPNRNGKEAFDEIRQLSPGVRVLFMSGYTADILDKTDLDVGLEFIAKPFSSADLKRKVRETLDREGPRR